MPDANAKGSAKSHNRRLLAWLIFGLAVMVGILWLLPHVIPESGAPATPTTEQKQTGDFVVIQDTFGSASATDFFRAYKAASAGDREGFSQMLEDGRIYRVPIGTRASCDRGSSQGAAVCSVSSGRLIGKTLFLRNDVLGETISGTWMLKAFPAESMTLAMKQFNMALNGIGPGGLELQYFEKHSTFTAKDLAEARKDPLPLMLKLSEVFSHSSDHTTNAALAVDLFGNSGPLLLPFLEKGPAGIAKLTTCVPVAGDPNSSITCGIQGSK